MPIARLTIEEHDANLDLKSLAEFLSLIEGCVVALNNLKIEWPGSGEIPPEISNRLKRVSPLEWNDYFDRTATELITIQTISRKSPLEITLVCAIGLITIAVVLSGGKIKISTDSLEAELPPLGKGIKSLKKAIGLSGKVTSSYSIRTIVIKLNKEEFDLLMSQDPAKKEGGFQSFLIGLQTRINRSTRELTLSDVDLERIERYKANPKKGGFQARFRKIFGRHFPDDESHQKGISG